MADAKDVLSKKGVTYKNIWFKSDSEAGKFTSNLYSFPTTYVIDQNGNIVGEPIMGGINSAEQREALNKLIEQRSRRADSRFECDKGVTKGQSLCHIFDVMCGMVRHTVCRPVFVRYIPYWYRQKS